MTIKLDHNSSSAQKSLTQKKRWYFLIVSDYGKIISVRRFKGLFIAALGLFLVGIVAAGTLLPLYGDAIAENKRLQHNLDVARQRLKSMQADMDVLLVRIVSAESLADLKSIAQEGKKLDDSDNAASAKPKTEVKELLSTSETKKGFQLPQGLSPDNDNAAVEDRAQMRQNGVSSITIENPRLFTVSSAGRLQLTFKIKNSGRKKISGTVFAILKPDDSAPSDWLIYPAVDLISEKPAPPEKGVAFSIMNFTTMEMKLGDLNDAGRFQKMAILVYDTSGEMLFEKHFPIESKAGKLSIGAME